MKKKPKTTKPKTGKKMTKADEYEFMLVIVSFMSVVIIGLCLYFLYDQNKKIEVTEKCSELMQYRNDVKLDTQWSFKWNCEVNGREVEEQILDQIINHYKASAIVMERAE